MAAALTASDQQAGVRISGISVPLQLLEVRSGGGKIVGRLTLLSGNMLHFEGDAAASAAGMADFIGCDAAAKAFLAALVVEYTKRGVK